MFEKAFKWRAGNADSTAEECLRPARRSSLDALPIPMEYREPTPSVLLLHDGELAELAEVVDALGGIDRRGNPSEADRTRAWDVIIASAGRMLELHEYIADHSAVRIAVLDGDSKTLRKMLLRVDTDLLVRQPVHPAALRLLILHALYHGPEKRRTSRVSMGAPIRFRSGLRRRPAILAELSTRGCRLMVDSGRHRAVPDRLLTVVLPPEVTGDGRPLSLRGHVMRVSTSDPGSDVIAVLFEMLGGATRKRLESVVAAHSHGPAVLDKADARPLGPPAPSPAALEPAATRLEECEAEPIPSRGDAPSPALAAGAKTDSTASVGDAPSAIHSTADAPSELAPRAAEPPPPEPKAAEAPSRKAEEPASEDVGERRTRDRHTMRRRIIALGDEAARVLIGRDLSVGGMRIDPTPEPALGDRLKVAVHIRPDGQPLVVAAEIIRDDGPNGMALRFCDLSPAAHSYLSEMVDALPSVIESDGTRGGAGLVVSELVGRRAS